MTQALIDIMIGCSSFIQVLPTLLERVTLLLSSIATVCQVEVISALPEILPDSQHPTMAVSLPDI